MKFKYLAFLILSTLIAKSGLSQIQEKRIVPFNGSKFHVPLPHGYSYFNNSIYKNMTMSDFTKNESALGNEIVELEILVPKNATPLIQIYSFSELQNLKLPKESFKSYKEYIKKAIIPSKYDSLSKTVF